MTVLNFLLYNQGFVVIKDINDLLKANHIRFLKQKTSQDIKKRYRNVKLLPNQQQSKIFVVLSRTSFKEEKF